MSVRGTIARNTLYNALGRGWEAGAGLVLTAYILSHLSAADWGLWSLVAVFTGYAALFDFGIGAGFTRYIAAHAARADRAAVSATVSTGLAAYVLFGIMVAGVGWPLAGWLGEVWLLPRLSDPAAAARGADLLFLVRGALVLFAMNNLLAPFLAVPAGLQRMGWSNAIGAAMTLVKIAATVAFLEAGFGLRGLLWANAVVLGATALGAVPLAFALAPGLRLGPRHVRRSAWEELFGFGWRSQVARLANLVNFQTDRLILAAYYGLGGIGVVGVYRYGEELAGKLRQLPALLASALVPAAADLDARAAEEQLAAMYLRSTKYLAAVSVPLTVFVLGTAELLLHAWLGARDGLDTAAHVLRILMLGYCANLIAGGGVSVALGRGRADLAMWAGINSMVTNIVLTVVLVATIGFWGVPIATAIGLYVSALRFGWAMRRVAPVPLATLARAAVFLPLAASVPGALLCGVGLWWVGGAVERLPNLLALGALAPGFGLSYLFALRALHYFDHFDRQFLGDTLRLRALPGFAWFAGEVPDA